MKTLTIEKNIVPILNVTKNVIKKSDNFNDYYIKENNKLYENQLPLLMRNSKIREVMSLKKLRIRDINNNISEENDSDNEKNDQIGDNSNIPLSIIRKPHIRSKKLPPLCPFFSQGGELLPQVVSTSKLYSRNIIQTDINYDSNISISSSSFEKSPRRRVFGSPINLKKIDHSNFYKILEINFDEFQKEILYDPKYNLLKYDNSEIFGHIEFYKEFIKGLVEEILILSGEEYSNDKKIGDNKEIKKEKIFEWGKNKKQIILTLNSLNIKIREIKDNNNDIKNEDKNDSNKKISNHTNCFEYILPLNLLPLFYYKGFDKFKLFLLSFIRFDEETQKFEINENISTIVNNLLTNCKDLKIKKDNEDEIDNDVLNILQPVDYKKSLNISRFDKKSSKNYQNYKPMAKSMNFGMSLLQNTLFAGTNVDITTKKKLMKAKYNLYPKEKKNDEYLNYSNFYFYWNISDKVYCINVEMPLITFNIPSDNIMVKQYINYELLFYLYKINFDTWDFYIINYLSSFKKFRILLSQLMAIKPKKNVNFFLENYKNRTLENTDYKIINIITSKFLSESLPEKPRISLKKKSFKLLDIKKFGSKKSITELKKEDKKEENNNNNEKDNKDNKEEIKEDKKEQSKFQVPTEETGQPIATTSSINELNSSKNINRSVIDNKALNNSILEQKCFIAIVTITDIEKSISNIYTIHFNYSHFSKCKSMEKYMKKTTFLLKFININYEKSTLSFDYESLNAFDETKWMNDLEKYNLNYKSEIKIEKEKNINKEEEKNGPPLIINKNRTEYPGARKGTSIIIEIKPPIILLRSFYKNGKIDTKPIEVSEEEENKLCLYEDNSILNLSKNIFDISLSHKKKEIEDKNTKDLADNILMNAFKKKFINKDN